MFKRKKGIKGSCLYTISYISLASSDQINSTWLILTFLSSFYLSSQKCISMHHDMEMISYPTLFLACMVVLNIYHCVFLNENRFLRLNAPKQDCLPLIQGLRSRHLFCGYGAAPEKKITARLRCLFFTIQHSDCKSVRP